MSVEIGENAALRQVGVRLLKQRGFTVTNEARGSGSPPFSRLAAIKGGERMIVVQKVVTKQQGRIHFTPEKDDGSWKALSGATHVLHVWRDPNSSQLVRVSLFAAKTVIDAFDENLTAKISHGVEDAYPCWISPEREDGWRFAGSGFGKHALWSQTVPLDLPEDSAPSPTSIGSSTTGIVDRMKNMLSEHMGIRPELIEIDIRIKL